MAEAIARHLLDEGKVPGQGREVFVASAGLGAWDGSPTSHETLETLRERGIRTLVMTGVATNVCVDSTLRDGFFLGYHIALAEDCVGSNSRAGHEGTLATVRNNIGGVLTSAALAETLQRLASSPSMRSAETRAASAS